MEEVEFINSRLENVGSQPRTDDNLSTSETVGASRPTATSYSSTSLGPRRTNDAVAILKIFNDAMTIYRSTLDNPIDRRRGRNNVDDEKNDETDVIVKIREDSLYVSDIIEDLMEEIETEGTYNVLIREIEDNKKKRRDEEIIYRNYAEAKKKIAELRELVIVETKTNARDREEPKAQLVRCKNENERLELTVNIESRYVRQREKARCEASFVRCGVGLKNRRDVLGNVVSHEKNECRVATEIEAFLEQNATANERARSQWKLRYDREMQMYEIENERLKKDIKNRRESLEKLRLEYQVRQDFIDGYLDEKAAALEQEKRTRHRHNCSIVIQSWWRGVMVRRKLGPYRPDEKKKKRPVKSKKQ